MKPSTPVLLLALAWPVLATAQLPPPARHPAASAHATAVAGQAAATRIEACAQAADTFINQLDKGDYQGAGANFDAKMQAALDPAKLGQAWQSVVQQYGKLRSRGTPQNLIYGGMAVITTPLRFDHGRLAVQLACDDAGRFAGFHVLPVPSAPAAAASTAVR